jgi:hypothetical protein
MLVITPVGNDWFTKAAHIKGAAVYTPQAALNGDMRTSGWARMTTLVALVLLVVVIAALALVAIRLRNEAQVRIRTHGKRAPDLEARIRTVLAGPRQKYGDIFSEYRVWKSGRETRLELTATAQWGRLNEFTRSLVVRYLWRVLESLAGDAVVVVDQPAQEWSVEVDAGFRDQGFDWKTFGSGPQFAQEP